MSKNIVEELPARKHAPIAAPVAKKEGVKPAADNKPSGDKKVVQKGGTSEEASAKRIKQAVYDIRYRARKDDIELSVAFQQYMSNSNLSAKEVAAVREKLGLSKSSPVKEQFTKGADDWATDGLANALYKVFVEQEDPEFELSYVRQLEESEDRKYKVRVTDRSGKAYVRYATRDKITELRGNSNIKSVEMTEHGSVVGSERKQGKQTAKAKAGKGLDPVGKEDSDIDNDGKPNDKNDKYIRNRREKIGQSIRMRAEEKLREGTTSVEAPPGTKKITGKGVDNYSAGVVKVNPTDKQEDPSDGKTRYAHLQLLGTNLSESQKKLLKIVAKKKEEEEKKEVASVMTKDKVDDPCAPKEGEEKKDMRGTYAKLNIIRNKFRAAGQRTPFVTLDDIGEERTAGYTGGPANMGKPDKSPEDSVKGPAPKEGPKTGKPVPAPKEGPGTKKPAPKVKTGPATKKPAPPKERYNPFTKDGKTRPGDRTPTSASQTTGP